MDPCNPCEQQNLPDTSDTDDGCFGDAGQDYSSGEDCVEVFQPQDPCAGQPYGNQGGQSPPVVFAGSYEPCRTPSRDQTAIPQRAPQNGRALSAPRQQASRSPSQRISSNTQICQQQRPQVCTPCTSGRRLSQQPFQSSLPQRRSSRSSQTNIRSRPLGPDPRQMQQQSYQNCSPPRAAVQPQPRRQTFGSSPGGQMLNPPRQSQVPMQRPQAAVQSQQRPCTPARQLQPRNLFGSPNDTFTNTEQSSWGSPLAPSPGFGPNPTYQSPQVNSFAVSRSRLNLGGSSVPGGRLCPRGGQGQPRQNETYAVQAPPPQRRQTYNVSTPPPNLSSPPMNQTFNGPCPPQGLNGAPSNLPPRSYGSPQGRPSQVPQGCIPGPSYIQGPPPCPLPPPPQQNQDHQRHPELRCMCANGRTPQPNPCDPPQEASRGFTNQGTGDGEECTCGLDNQEEDEGNTAVVSRSDNSAGGFWQQLQLQIFQQKDKNSGNAQGNNDECQCGNEDQALTPAENESQRSGKMWQQLTLDIFQSNQSNDDSGCENENQDNSGDQQKGWQQQLRLQIYQERMGNSSEIPPIQSSLNTDDSNTQNGQNAGGMDGPCCIDYNPDTVEGCN